MNRSAPPPPTLLFARSAAGVCLPREVRADAELDCKLRFDLTTRSAPGQHASGAAP